MTQGSPGSAYQPSAEITARLGAWKRGCDRGMSTREIAHQLGIPQATLVRSIQRARAHGHPDAVTHPNAERWVRGAGFSGIIGYRNAQRRAYCRAHHDHGQALAAGT